MASSLDEMLDNIMAACGGRADEALGRGDALFAQGQFHKALVHFMAAKKLRPGAECDYRIGLAYWRVGDLASARGAFEQAVQAKENFGEAQCELGRVYLALGNIQSAIAHARRAVEIAPDNRDFAVAWASVLEADGQSDAAGEIVARILRGGDASVDLALVFARLAPGLHREEHALELIAQNLRQSSGSAQRSALHFAAANLLDRLGRYDEAFEQATDANALRGVRYDPPQVEASFQHWIDCFDRAAVARMPRATDESDVPVFIVGMPRSGTSLVEQILASHPSVHGGGELNWIANLCGEAVRVASAARQPTLKALWNLSPADLNRLAAGYVTALTAFNPGARRVTDKMPTNFIYLGLIAMLFPRARIIHCRRDPLDTCLSCFMTDFAGGYEFAFDQISLGHFYRQYERLMSHWKSVLAPPTLEVSYERVVSDVDGEARRMIEFLGLRWDAACLAFFENRRFVATASVGQVRKPIYANSVGRWRHYQNHLAPLQAELAR